MCGLAGFITSSFSNEMWKDILIRMADTITHRGPDDRGVWFDSEAGFGAAHCRLSIIDISREGHQPMVSVSGRYVIVYNGEIYNHIYLRKALQTKNIKWRGHSDTEVMLAAIENWGVEEAVKSFIGMFAFALWDRNERILYLCRDRLGIKPLYYAKTKKGIVFGSELKALKVFPDFKSEIDRDALTLYLRHNCIPAPYSIYRDTWKLCPGHILSIPVDASHDGRKLPDSYPYWSAKSVAISGTQNPFCFSASEAVKQLEVLLRNAVGMRMISDVPLGAFLSGGIDSSTIVALMQAESSRPVKTFSIGFFESGYNEAQQAKSVAEHLGTDHTELYVTSRDAMGVIPDLPRLYDEPFSDSSQIPTFLLSKLTREHVTVSLSGDGGDELFGGYNRYNWVPKIYRRLDRIPVFFRKMIATSMRVIPPAVWDSILNRTMSIISRRFMGDIFGDKIHKLSEIVSTDSLENMYKTLISHWKEPREVVINGYEPITLVSAENSSIIFSDYICNMMYLDLVTYLPDDILTKVDRASMGVGLEVRVPFLDHRVVEFAWRLPLSMKFNDKQSKWILRQILYNYVPKELVERPKSGFSIPIDSWLRGELRDWAESLLEDKRLKDDGFFDPAPIQEKWAEHLSGKFNWQYPLWDILMFQCWFENQK